MTSNSNTIIGAVVGDVIGSVFEWNNIKTTTGHLSFNTSSSIKYTCIKIRFVGLVSTKVAKTAEEIYVLNQQIVLFGNPNNTEEAVLPEGKHSWPFEFMVPLHHIPSSGKVKK